jgi:hypothetical protein
VNIDIATGAVTKALFISICNFYVKKYNFEMLFDRAILLGFSALTG